jgi:hypothetical protein
MSAGNLIDVFQQTWCLHDFEQAIHRAASRKNAALSTFLMRKPNPDQGHRLCDVMVLVAVMGQYDLHLYCSTK